jgi:hypothetical protein
MLLKVFTSALPKKQLLPLMNTDFWVFGIWYLVFGSWLCLEVEAILPVRDSESLTAKY